ncbi:MAG: type II CAAX endopeptidase family protein [Bacteroidota bacterium]
MTDGEASTHDYITKKREPDPWSVAIFTFLVTLAAFVIVAPFIGMGIAYPFYNGDGMEYLEDLQNPIGNESMKMIYYFIQGFATLFGLAIIPAFFWQRLTHKPALGLFKGTPLKPIHFLITAGIVFFFLGFMSVVMEWNSNIDLPNGSFENWAKSTEEQLAEITRYLTSFSNVGQYLVGVFVIAILAGIGEELVFRGLLQPELHKATGNIHVAIWVSALFFSALHLQFYGFFPRMLLGALFGYLYYWSGNLFVPMFAHFANNFLAVSSIYFGLSEVPGMETEPTQQEPWYVVFVMTAICGTLIYIFYKQFQKPDDVRA